MSRFSTFNDSPEFVAKFMELLILDEGMIQDLITAGEFAATGHPVLDCIHPNGECDCCYSGDTSYEMCQLPNRMAEVWAKARKAVTSEKDIDSSSAEEESNESDE